MNQKSMARRFIPLALLGLVLLLPSVGEACITVYLDAWEDAGDVYGWGFVEDYYDSGSCYYDVIGEWDYWEHSYEADVHIESPTQNTAGDNDTTSNVGYGGGLADAFGLISTDGDHGVYTVTISVTIACTVAGPGFFEEGSEPEVQSCVVPSGETTSWHGFNATHGLWRGTLYDGSSTNFSGRTVTEQDPGNGGPDTCHFPNSFYDPFEAITGGSWPVGSGNVWGTPNGTYDGVGWGTDVVTYYRTAGQAPCATTFSQRMEISCPNGPNQTYELNGLGAGITTTTVSSCRAGSCEIRNWP